VLNANEIKDSMKLKQSVERCKSSLSGYGRNEAGRRVIKSYISYPWEDVQETREHKGKPWHVWGNPYNWALSWEPYTPSKETSK